MPDSFRENAGAGPRTFLSARVRRNSSCSAKRTAFATASASDGVTFTRHPLCGARLLARCSPALFGSGCCLVTGFALSADAFEQNAGRFVIRVLGHKLALEGAFEDGLAQPVCTFQVGFDLRFKLINNRETALSFGYDALLFGGRRQGYGEGLELCAVHVCLTNLLADRRLDPGSS